MPRPRMLRLFGSAALAVAVLVGFAVKPAPAPVPEAADSKGPLVEIEPNVSTPAEILKAYQALGLPLPPVSARLVRLAVLPERYVLAFELEAGAKSAPSRNGGGETRAGRPPARGRSHRRRGGHGPPDQ